MPPIRLRRIGRLDPPLSKHSIIIGIHRTSISLEDAFWEEFKAIAAERNLTLDQMATFIYVEGKKPGAAPTANLSSAIRLFVLTNIKTKLAHCKTTLAEFKNAL